MDPSSEDCRQAVDYWMPTAMDELDSGAAQIDLDNIFDVEPTYAVATALECGAQAIAHARESHPDTIGLVTVPLDYSQELSTTVPDLKTLLAQEWVYGPGREVPGIYLLAPRMLSLYSGREEYRAPMDAAELLPAGWTAYYYCWRRRADADRGWEFSRDVFIRTVD